MVNASVKSLECRVTTATVAIALGEAVPETCAGTPPNTAAPTRRNRTHPRASAEAPFPRAHERLHATRLVQIA